MSSFNIGAKFLMGSAEIGKLSRNHVPEIAILGRSNVGKSTLINRLTRSKSLARTSSTPGRTRQVNLFEVELSRGKAKKQTVMLADLPGFGFAKISKVERESLAKLTVDYIRNRAQARVVLLLNDCRRAPQEDEISVQEMAFANDKRLLIVLTKCDKLKRNELAKQRRLIAQAYRLEEEDLLMSDKDLEPDPFWENLLDLIKH
ncbi:MAG: ribosome biogenesis GTP-binding protein YsxC [Deltaproteobacteria bacterium]|nr:ribosome biogenesis GTP-binding protein YsxC [Deltaproteobacteria bacterium]